MCCSHTLVPAVASDFSNRHTVQRSHKHLISTCMLQLSSRLAMYSMHAAQTRSLHHSRCTFHASRPFGSSQTSPHSQCHAAGANMSCVCKLQVSSNPSSCPVRCRAVLTPAESWTCRLAVQARASLACQSRSCRRFDPQGGYSCSVHCLG